MSPASRRAFLLTADKPPLEKPFEERRRRVRNADDLVGCLAVEFEVELGLGPAILPVLEALELTAAKAPRRQGSATDGDTDPWRLPFEIGTYRDGLRGGHDTARDKPLPAFV